MQLKSSGRRRPRRKHSVRSLLRSLVGRKQSLYNTAIILSAGGHGLHSGCLGWGYRGYAGTVAQVEIFYKPSNVKSVIFRNYMILLILIPKKPPNISFKPSRFVAALAV